MVDDSSNRSNGANGGRPPSGGTLPEEFDAARADADSILKLLKARLELPDMAQSDALPAGGRGATGNPYAEEGKLDAVGSGVRDSIEMTPAPMVVASAIDGTPTAPHASARDVRIAADRTSGSKLEAAAESSSERWIDSGRTPGAAGAVATIGGDEPRGTYAASSDLDTKAHGQVEYHSPRKPPTSIVPPPAAPSFSVAPQYDPKAPTRPKVRRNPSSPPPPLLFGLDRMLVWGLVLGGLFVAVIVVIVHQLALPSVPRTENAATSSERDSATQAGAGPLTPQGESTALEGQDGEPAATVPRDGQTAVDSASAVGSGSDGPDSGLGRSGGSPTSASTRDSTNSPAVQPSEKARPPAIGAGSNPESQRRPSRSSVPTKKSWID